MGAAQRTGLEAIRLEQEISRARAAHVLNISERHLYRIERGITPAKRSYLLILAGLYGTPMRQIEAAAREIRNGVAGADGVTDEAA